MRSRPVSSEARRIDRLHPLERGAEFLPAPGFAQGGAAHKAMRGTRHHEFGYAVRCSEFGVVIEECPRHVVQRAVEGRIR